ncbi:MAG: hypothetical protein IID08_04915 [Candidatus Hydrogenedentes bacterium]|nr:hypothetical protein [Candidatus Hydrogenedentota bacterium]
MRSVLRSSGAFLCVLLAACGGSRDGDSGPNRGVADRALLARAEELAQSEIARLAAEALVYRSNAELHETILPVIGSKVGVYVKMYREFTGYEVVDIVRSNSILYPVEIAIRFDFDVLATEVRSIGAPDAQVHAQADYRFRVFRQDSVRRRYRCDPEGNPVDILPELPRLKFYGGVSATDTPGPSDRGSIPF